jgi:hypothetical protein
VQLSQNKRCVALRQSSEEGIQPVMKGLLIFRV